MTLDQLGFEWLDFRDHVRVRLLAWQLEVEAAVRKGGSKRADRDAFGTLFKEPRQFGGFLAGLDPRAFVADPGPVSATQAWIRRILGGSTGPARPPGEKGALLDELGTLCFLALLTLPELLKDDELPLPSADGTLVREVRDACLGALRASLADDPLRGLRAGEVVLARILGWHRPRTPAEHVLKPLPWGQVAAREVVRRHVLVSVDVCLGWLRDKGPPGEWRNRDPDDQGPGVIGFPSLEPGLYVSRVLTLLLAPRPLCRCWTLAVPGDPDPDPDPAAEPPADPEEVAEALEAAGRFGPNVAKKVGYHLRFHHLSAFEPAERAGQRSWTLWSFLEAAPKGFIGHFKAAGFTPGILWWLLQVDAGKGTIPRLELAWIARFRCPECQGRGVGTVYSVACADHRLPTRPRPFRRLIVEGVDGGFDVTRPMWACAHPGCEAALFDAVDCGSPCNPLVKGHDACPECRIEHPQPLFWPCDTGACRASNRVFRALRCGRGCGLEHDHCEQCSHEHAREHGPRLMGFKPAPVAASATASSEPLYWRCETPDCRRAGRAYRALRCRPGDCGPVHDSCPACDTRHPGAPGPFVLALRPKPLAVRFFTGSPVVVEPLGPRPEDRGRPLEVADPRGPRHPASRPASCGRADWHELHEALGALCRRATHEVPSDPEVLRAKYLGDLWPALSKTIAAHAKKKGLDRAIGIAIAGEMGKRRGWAHTLLKLAGDDLERWSWLFDPGALEDRGEEPTWRS